MLEITGKTTVPRFSRFSCLEPLNPWTSGRSYAVPRGVTAACQGSSNSSFHVEKVCLEMVCWVWWVWCWKLKIERMIVHCVWYCRYLMYSVMMHVSCIILIYFNLQKLISIQCPGEPQVFPYGLGKQRCMGIFWQIYCKVKSEKQSLAGWLIYYITLYTKGLCHCPMLEILSLTSLNQPEFP